MKREQNRIAIASLVLGIVSIVCCWVWYVGCVIAIAGLALGIIAIQDEKPGESGLSLAGIITSSVGLFLSVMVVFFLILAFSSGEMSRGNPGINQGTGTALWVDLKRLISKFF